MCTGGLTNGGISRAGFEWAIRLLVLASLAAHIFLAFFAGFRRRQRSGVTTVILWLAYLFTDWAAPYAIGKLPFGSALREQQLVALWIPFLLSHLGGPDNITAFSFEDNKLSLRKAGNTLFHLLGTISSVYKQVDIGGSNRALLWASYFMISVGAIKYIEKAWALRVANFGKIRKAAKNNLPTSIRIQLHRHGKELNDEEALLVAHSLLHITKGAFADYSVRKGPFRSNQTLREVFNVQQENNNTGWLNMCKVVEMELSLIYDILYTKAAKIQTCLISYVIRIVSPVTTATMAMLFWYSSKAAQRGVDVIITYILLMVTFCLDVRWLLRVTASTWTYAFFNNAKRESWLKHEVLCTGRWHRIRRLIVSLDPRQLLLRQQRGNYRLWTGVIGKYNLLDECIHDTDNYIYSQLLKLVIRSEDTLTEYKYSRGYKLGTLGTRECLRELLFEQIKRALGKAYPRHKVIQTEMPAPGHPPPPKAGVEGEYDYSQTQQSTHLLDVALGFVPELQELILILHVATDVFLVDMSNQVKLVSDKEMLYKEAIEVMSNYMAFLAAARPEMLPGLDLRSLFKGTCRKLHEIWENESAKTSSKHILAHTLQQVERNRRKNGDQRSTGEGDGRSFVLSEGVMIADVLIWAMQGKLVPYEDIIPWLKIRPQGEDDKDFEKRKDRVFFLLQLLLPDLKMGLNKTYPICELLELILESWVRLLINVSTRCGRDSHAKQLGRGCELTTIVWILSHHASVFGI
ncbi:unnamed protein product [Urochloa decumbens]|uniref:DUF4220 domain-containing protein n=1 Tax=Urochloa decumbens TaxID=240449 RepID=A0ABC9AUW2_9POAL